jgi:hypothetical protein
MIIFIFYPGMNMEKPSIQCDPSPVQISNPRPPEYETEVPFPRLNRLVAVLRFQFLLPER